MKDNERIWKIIEIVLGVIGAALLVTILVLRLMGKNVTVFTYMIVGVVILFLIADEFARSIRRKHEKEQKKEVKNILISTGGSEESDHSGTEDPKTSLPKDAFDFESESKKEHL